MVNSPPSSDQRWFPYNRVREKPLARLQLFCLPNAGGGGTVYRGWQSQLPQTIDVVPIELPGRFTRIREPLLPSMPSLVASLAEVVQRRLDKPFAIFGYSMGGLIGFELARALIARTGMGPRCLVVAARPAPSVAMKGPSLSSLATSGLLEEVARRWGALPAEVVADPEMCELFTGVLRADLRLVESYTPSSGPLLKCPIAALGGKDDASTTEAELEAWRSFTTGPFTLQMFAGGHFFRNDSPEAVLAFVRANLESAMED